MKASSVREGSKEKSTQVTGNRIYKRCLVCKVTLPGQAPIRQNSPGVDCAQEPIWKIPLVSIALRRRGQTLENRVRLPRLSVPPSMWHPFIEMVG